MRAGNIFVNSGSCGRSVILSISVLSMTRGQKPQETFQTLKTFRSKEKEDAHRGPISLMNIVFHKFNFFIFNFMGVFSDISMSILTSCIGRFPSLVLPVTTYNSAVNSQLTYWGEMNFEMGLMIWKNNYVSVLISYVEIFTTVFSWFQFIDNLDAYSCAYNWQNGGIFFQPLPWDLKNVLPAQINKLRLSSLLATDFHGFPAPHHEPCKNLHSNGYSYKACMIPFSFLRFAYIGDLSLRIPFGYEILWDSMNSIWDGMKK